MSTKPRTKTSESALRKQLFVRLCQDGGLPTPLPEYRFFPGRQWRIDYYFTNGDKRVALEVEGGVFTGGRHTRPKGFLGDIEKYNAMATMGILLLRVTPKDLLTRDTIDLVKRTLNSHE